MGDAAAEAEPPLAGEALMRAERSAVEARGKCCATARSRRSAANDETAEEGAEDMPGSQRQGYDSEEG